MTTAQVLVDIAGLTAMAWIVWYFWFFRQEGVQVDAIGGLQEAVIKVKGGNDPDVIVVKRGGPVRLHFERQESAPCSEMVVFDRIDRSARLPEGETVTVSSLPRRPVRSPSSARWGCCVAR